MTSEGLGEIFDGELCSEKLNLLTGEANKLKIGRWKKTMLMGLVFSQTTRNVYVKSHSNISANQKIALSGRKGGSLKLFLEWDPNICIT